MQAIGCVCAALVLAAARYVICRAIWQQKVTPDGMRYYAVARGSAVSIPFHRRWLWPRVLGTNPTHWRWCSAAFTIALPALLAWWMMDLGFAPWRALAGACLLMGLPGVFHVMATYPALVDSQCMATALLCAIAAHHANNPDLASLCIFVALLGGCMRESVPVFAAMFALSPLPLIGLVSTIVSDRLFARQPREVEERPRRTAHSSCAKMLCPMLMLWPWGACLAALWRPDLRAALCAAGGYGLLLVVNDTMRCYQSGAPGVVACAIAALPDEWLLPACVAQWFLIWWHPSHKALPGL